MIALVLFAMADPPDGVDRDDVERWEALSDAALDGPPGCWELSGDLAVTSGLLSKASFRKRTRSSLTPYRGTWSGTLREGKWTRFEYHLTEPADEIEDAPDLSIHPVVGTIDSSIVVNLDAPPPEEKPEPKGRSVRIGVGKQTEEDDPEEALNIIRRSMDAWDTSTAISMSQWRESTREIELIQETPITDSPTSPTLTLTTRIPEGEWVARISAVFPRKFTVGTWPLTAKLHDTQFHLVQRRIEDHVFPAAENISSVGTALGFTVSYEQRLDYRNARPCGD